MRILKRGLLVIGIILLFYPILSSVIQNNKQQEIISSYEKQHEEMQEEDLKAEWKKAKEYNSMLYQTQSIGIGTSDYEILSKQSYDSLLDFTNTGMMGSLSIPKINVELPVYHGTDEQVLAKAVGHVENTSLPIGGENTHCVLSSHRGLPNAKLFTRLDELEQGNLFLIHVGGEKLVYQVTEIQVIKPEEVESLMIQSGKDLVSLVTCTPYGLNTHRLVVTGERIDYVEDEIEISTVFSFSWREAVFTILPFAVAGIVIVQKISDLRKKKSKKGEIDRGKTE